jgi:hypothetical protein
MAFDQIQEVMPAFFLVRIPKEAQRERLEKIGILYYPPAYVYMKRGMQCAEILKIGSAAHEFFPEAKVGDILIVHHFIEGKVSGMRDKFFMVHSDEDWNYYCVTAFCFNGDRNNTFGVYDGEKIIPSKDYVFFEIDQTPTSDFPDFMLDVPWGGKIHTNIAFQQADADLVVPKYRKKTRTEMIEKMAENKKEIMKLARWPIHLDKKINEKVTPMIKRLEAENDALSKQINKRQYEAHILYAFNDELLKTVNPNLRKGDRAYVLNIAAYMQVEFMGVEYIVSESKYVSIKAPNKVQALSAL